MCIDRPKRNAEDSVRIKTAWEEERKKQENIVMSDLTIACLPMSNVQKLHLVMLKIP